jgi:hypothetical protein
MIGPLELDGETLKYDSFYSAYYTRDKIAVYVTENLCKHPEALLLYLRKAIAQQREFMRSGQ